MTRSDRGQRDNSSDASAETQYVNSDGSGASQETPSKHTAPVNSPAPASAAESSILHEVVAKTVAEDLPLREAEWDALRRVARQLAGESFAEAPVGFALVESMLALRYPKYDATAESWRSMTEQITAAFFAAPLARERLERLWQRLCESLP